MTLLDDPEGASGGVTGHIIRNYVEENLPVIGSPGRIFIHDNTPTHTAGGWDT